MAEFTVSSQMLRDKAAGIRGKNSEFTGLTDEITQLINSLSSSWEGDAYTNFVSKFEGLKPSFTAYSQVIEEYAAFLENAATSYEQAESQAQNEAAELENTLFK